MRHRRHCLNSLDAAQTRTRLVFKHAKHFSIISNQGKEATMNELGASITMTLGISLDVVAKP